MTIMTLAQCLLNDYTEEELRYWSRFYGVRIGSSKPATLASRIAAKLLEEQEMQQRLVILRDEEAELFEQCMEESQPVSDEQKKAAERLIGTDYAYMTSSGLIVPADVTEAYRRLNTPAFRKQRILTSYLLDCLLFVESVYLVIPLHELMGCFTGRYSILCREEVFERCWNMIHPDDNPCVRTGDMIISRAASDVAAEILEERGSHMYVYPDPGEISDWAVNGYPSKNSECMYFLEWLKDSGLEHSYAEEVLQHLTEMIAHGTEMEEVLEALKTHMDITEPRFVPAEIRLKALYSSIRSTLLSGAAPADDEADMMRAEGVQGNGEVLYAKTVLEAAKLIEKRPVLVRLGYIVQVEKYAETVLVAFQRPGQRKTYVKILIFPNDPCPCGSGSPYRECHGRKRS